MNKQVNMPQSCARYLAHLKHGKGLSSGTITEYKKDLEMIHLYAISEAKKTIQDLSAMDVDDYLSKELSRGLRATTLNRRLATLRGYLHYCYRHEIISKDVAGQLDNVKRGYKLPKSADLGIVSGYLQTRTTTFADAESKALIALICTTGIRISEALNIEFADIDKVNMAIKIHGKGNKERVVYYSPSSQQYLNDYAKLKSSRVGRVFGFNYQEAYRAICWRLRDKDGKGINPHQLRHMFASMMYERGVELKTISEMLGHSSVRTTETYTHLTPTTIRKAYTEQQIMFN